MVIDKQKINTLGLHLNPFLLNCPDKPNNYHLFEEDSVPWSYELEKALSTVEWFERLSDILWQYVWHEKLLHFTWTQNFLKK